MSLGIVALFKKIYDSEPILTVVSNISKVSVLYKKYVTGRNYTDIGKQLSFANNRNRVRGVVLNLSQDGACTNLFENFRENS